MIGQQLERYDVQNRREHAVIFRQTNDVHSFLRGDVAIPIGKNIQFAPSGTDFLHVAFKVSPEADHSARPLQPAYPHPRVPMGRALIHLLDTPLRGYS